MSDDVAKRKRKKPKSRSQKRGIGALIQIAPLLIPLRNLTLVGSIMNDLGIALPSKRNRLNNRIKKLIEDGVISKDGIVAASHPVIQQWHVIERRTKSAASGGCTRF